MKKLIMKKLILFLFVALLTQVFTSCKDDDVYHITDTDLNGVYLGTMDVDAPFGGVQLGADDIKQKIYITKTGENLVTLQLKDFTLIIYLSVRLKLPMLKLIRFMTTSK